MASDFGLWAWLLRSIVLGGGFLAVGAATAAVVASLPVDRRVPQVGAGAMALALLVGRGQAGVFSRRAALLPSGPLAHLGPDAALLAVAAAATWWLGDELGPAAALVAAGGALVAVALGDGLGGVGAIHVLAAALWVGPLPWLIRRPEAARSLGGVAVAAGVTAVLTGLVLALPLQAEPTPFGAVLAVKVGLAAILAACGGFTWWSLRTGRSGRTAAVTLCVEAVLAALVLLLAAVLVGLSLGPG